MIPNMYSRLLDTLENDSSKSMVLKVVQMKNRKILQIKKPAVTPTFCKQNLSQMHHIEFIYTLLPVPSPLYG